MHYVTWSGEAEVWMEEVLLVLGFDEGCNFPFRVLTSYPLVSFSLENIS